MSRAAFVLRTAVPTIAIMASVIFWSFEPRGKPHGALLNPPGTSREEPHTLLNLARRHHKRWKELLLL
jgi:hypothetical protein